MPDINAKLDEIKGMLEKLCSEKDMGDMGDMGSEDNSMMEDMSKRPMLGMKSEKPILKIVIKAKEKGKGK